MLAVSALTALLVGAAPRWAGLSWLVVLYSVVVVWFGPILRLPDWAMKLSPIELTPSLPTDSLAWAPLVGLGAVAVVLGVLALAGFRRRDLLA